MGPAVQGRQQHGLGAAVVFSRSLPGLALAERRQAMRGPCNLATAGALHPSAPSNASAVAASQTHTDAAALPRLLTQPPIPPSPQAVHDAFIWGPNMVGCLFGGLQVLLCMLLPREKVAGSKYVDL